MKLVKIAFGLFFCFHQLLELSYSLEIDEKLTLRFLKVSGTQKTVLINRGAEDGLVVGDHAKFYTSTGVVARGVAEKVSPSRSVWSLYRLVEPLQVIQDKVLNLKIATPVKITDDPSKSITEIPVEGGGSESINLSGNESSTSSADSSVDSSAVGDEKEIQELTGPEEENVAAHNQSNKKLPKMIAESNRLTTEGVSGRGHSYKDKSKSWEGWGSLAINSLTGTFQGTALSGATDASFTSTSASSVEFALGIEKYFFNSNQFLSNFSLIGFAHKRSLKNGEEVKVTNSWFEYGGGINYHFYNAPADINTLIGFTGITYGKGNVDLEFAYIKDNGVGTTTTVSGSNSFYSLGLGLKYVFSNGLGLRSVADYYKSVESFDTAGALERSLSGIRFFLGGSYRF